MPLISYRRYRGSTFLPTDESALQLKIISSYANENHLLTDELPQFTLLTSSIIARIWLYR